jgi:hypothetical protein
MSTQSEELNCSEGARMLIDRMKSHPDDVKYNGRFMRITDQILGRTPVGYSELSDRDMNALTAAYEKYILEPSLTEYVVDEIFNGDKRREEEMKNAARGYTANLAASMRTTQNQIASSLLTGFTDPRMVVQSTMGNPAQGRVLWTEETGLQENKSPSIFDEMRRKLKRKPK